MPRHDDPLQAAANAMPSVARPGCAAGVCAPAWGAGLRPSLPSASPRRVGFIPPARPSATSDQLPRLRQCCRTSLGATIVPTKAPHQPRDGARNRNDHLWRGAKSWHWHVWTALRILIRGNPATDPDAIRPPVPIQAGHLFRSNPATPWRLARCSRWRRAIATRPHFLPRLGGSRAQPTLRRGGAQRAPKLDAAVAVMGEVPPTPQRLGLRNRSILLCETATARSHELEPDATCSTKHRSRLVSSRQS